MFRWFVQMVRGWLGRLFSKMEDPEATLEQLMRDMEARVPRLRAAVAQARAEKEVAEQAYQAYEKELARAEDPHRRKHLETQLQDKKVKLDVATQQAEQAEQTLDNYVNDMDTKFAQMRSLIAKHKQTEMLESYAKLKQGFEVGDEAQVLDELSRRINERIERHRRHDDQ